MIRIKRNGKLVAPEAGEIIQPARHAANARRQAANPDERFHRLWASIHRRPAAYDGNAEGELAWVQVIDQQLPCGECRRHWRAMLTSLPPDLSSREAYFATTVEWHNTINRRLGKPVMTLDDARAVWTRSP
ncbi:MAG TPA: ERV1/ALR-related protein [Tepidisphaeraceae bacterium]